MGSITTHTSSYYDIRCAYYRANLSYISIKSIYFYPLYVCLLVYISCVNIVLFMMFVIVLCTEQYVVPPWVELACEPTVYMPGNI